MKSSGLIRAAMLSVLLIIPVLPATAQVDQAGADANESIDAYEDLYDAVRGGMDLNLMIATSIEAIRRQYRQIPEFIALEEESPGFVDAYVEAIRPVLEEGMVRVDQETRLEMIALIRKELTIEQAKEVAAHYRTPVMRKLMGNVAENFSPDSTLSDIDSGEAVSEQKVNQDLARAAMRGTQALTAEERMQIARKMARSPALRKFEALSSKVVAIRTAKENEPPRPEEQAKLDKIVAEFFESRFSE